MAKTTITQEDVTNILLECVKRLINERDWDEKEYDEPDKTLRGRTYITFDPKTLSPISHSDRQPKTNLPWIAFYSDDYDYQTGTDGDGWNTPKETYYDNVHCNAFEYDDHSFPQGMTDDDETVIDRFVEKNNKYITDSLEADYYDEA